MSHPDTTPAPAGYVPANGYMCPIGEHLVCRDFNAMPQRMWRSDRQAWRCEGCGVPMVRTHTPGRGWGPWQRADQPAAS